MNCIEQYNNTINDFNFDIKLFDELIKLTVIQDNLIYSSSIIISDLKLIKSLGTFFTMIKNSIESKQNYKILFEVDNENLVIKIYYLTDVIDVEEIIICKKTLLYNESVVDKIILLERQLQIKEEELKKTKYSLTKLISRMREMREIIKENEKKLNNIPNNNLLPKVAEKIICSQFITTLKSKMITEVKDKILINWQIFLNDLNEYIVYAEGHIHGGQKIFITNKGKVFLTYFRDSSSAIHHLPTFICKDMDIINMNAVVLSLIISSCKQNGAWGGFYNLPSIINVENDLIEKWKK